MLLFYCAKSSPSMRYRLPLGTPTNVPWNTVWKKNESPTTAPWDELMASPSNMAWMEPSPTTVPWVESRPTTVPWGSKAAPVQLYDYYKIQPVPTTAPWGELADLVLNKVSLLHACILAHVSNYKLLISFFDISIIQH